MHAIPIPNKKELRHFGLLTGAIVILMFGLLIPWLRGHGLPQWPWTIAVMLWSCSILAPLALRPVYQIWMRIGLILGWINTRIILGAIFFGMIAPMAIIMRLFKRDPMTRKLDSNLKTYRSPAERKPRLRMEKPF